MQENPLSRLFVSKHNPRAERTDREEINCRNRMRAQGKRSDGTSALTAVGFRDRSDAFLYRRFFLFSQRRRRHRRAQQTITRGFVVCPRRSRVDGSSLSYTYTTPHGLSALERTRLRLRYLMRVTGAM